PTDSRDVTIFYNDFGVGYYLYRRHDCERILSAIAPTFEAHVNTPLDHRGSPRPGEGFLPSLIRTPDVLDLTAGTNFEFNDRARLAVGVCVPVTGPKPFDVEALAQLRGRD